MTTRSRPKEPAVPALGVDDSHASLATLAYSLDLTKRRITQLAEDGIVVRHATGVYWFKRSIRNYIRMLRARNGQDESHLEGKGPPQPSGYEAAKARKMIADAERAELELVKLAGKFVRTDHISALWEEMLGLIRGMILALPSKMARLVQNETDIRVIEAILRDAAHQALSEMSRLQLPAEAIPDHPDQDLSITKE